MGVSVCYLDRILGSFIVPKKKLGSLSVNMDFTLQAKTSEKKIGLVSSKLSSPDDLVGVKVESKQHTQIIVFLNHRKLNNHFDSELHR